MAQETRNPPASLFEAVKPDLESAPLVVSSDILVMMLRIIGALRAFLLIPAIAGSSACRDMKAEVLDMERRIAALLKAVDELAEIRKTAR